MRRKRRARVTLPAAHANDLCPPLPGLLYSLGGKTSGAGSVRICFGVVCAGVPAVRGPLSGADVGHTQPDGLLRARAGAPFITLHSSQHNPLSPHRNSSSSSVWSQHLDSHNGAVSLDFCLYIAASLPSALFSPPALCAAPSWPPVPLLRGRPPAAEPSVSGTAGEHARHPALAGACCRRRCRRRCHRRCRRCCHRCIRRRCRSAAPLGRSARCGMIKAPCAARRWRSCGSQLLRRGGARRRA